MIRKSVLKLQDLGRLPDESQDDDIPQAFFDLFEYHLNTIQQAITKEEAKILIKLFPETSCYGMGWSLLHLIESTPDWPIQEIIDMCPSTEWTNRLLSR